MLERFGEMFDAQDVDAICITTNGYITKKGRLVMGRGCALTAKKRFKNIDLILARKRQKEGLRVTIAIEKSTNHPAIVAFPVKPISRENTGPNSIVPHMRARLAGIKTIPGWACTAEIGLIKKSAEQLVALADIKGWTKIALPRPGCGAGMLSWEKVVKPALSDILDDRFIVYTFG